MHVGALAAIGGVPKAVVCDNLKAGVTKALCYEPGVNRTYQDLATHYGFAILPTRVRKPRDKAKVEVAVQIVQRFVLDDCATGASSHSTILISRSMVRRRSQREDHAQARQSRRELLETIERPALKALPAEPYRNAEWRRARVAPDYHVEIAGHFYSVPSRLIREVVEARITDTTIEISIAARALPAMRSLPCGTGTPRSRAHADAHRRYAEWTPARLMREAEKIGPATLALFEAIMRAKPHPEQGSAPASAFCGSPRDMASSGSMPPAGAATTSALAATAPSPRSTSMASTAYREGQPPEGPPIRHGNIRGRGYYH